MSDINTLLETTISQALPADWQQHPDAHLPSLADHQQYPAAQLL